MPLTAIVTGASGFVGRHMSKELARRGWKVDGIDVAPAAIPNSNLYHHYSIDARKVFNFPGKSATYDLVVHAAAQAPHRDAIDKQPTSHIFNRMLDATMFNWAINTNQRHVLYLSSCAVLDEVPDAYGSLKLSGEEMAHHARQAGLTVSVVRPFSGYGEDQGTDWPFGAFLARAMARQDPFEVWNPDAVRDWIHIDDVVAGALAVAESGTAFPVSLCTGRATSMRDVIAMMTDAVGYSPSRLDIKSTKSQGAAYRVGYVGLLQQYYQPTITLEMGIARALMEKVRSG